ncbi:hypothetical protein H1R20_g14824, partial [Candolleomyces eurysporus]
MAATSTQPENSPNYHLRDALLTLYLFPQNRPKSCYFPAAVMFSNFFSPTPNSNPPDKPRVGRPKGRKDGPRADNAPPRGRPKKNQPPVPSQLRDGATVTAATETNNGTYNDIDALLLDECSSEFLAQVNIIEREALGQPSGSAENGSREDTERDKSMALLEDSLNFATRSSQIQPFFTSKGAALEDADDSDDEPERDQRAAGVSSEAVGIADDGKPWFRKPARMSGWLYKYFGTIIKPILYQKNGKNRAAPQSFDENVLHAPASLWIYPPDPIFSLSRHRFDPTLLFRPRVFLWLPHFHVEELVCPYCKSCKLEKNGPAPPRRIVDFTDHFYIVTWQYYCRSGCRSYVAVLSLKGGLSREVITTLRVANQHKMGPSGVRALLLENHTLRFNRIQNQYLEAALEVVRGKESMKSQQSIQSTLHSYIGTIIPDFGHFGEVEGYGGFVCSEKYLTTMMIHAIEQDEQVATQHTSLIAPDQLAVDDSHKVNKHIAKIDGVPIFTALWTAMDSRYIRAQALTLTKAHDERLGPLVAMSRSMKRYGYSDPPVAFSDDPVKDKALLYSAFPSLAQGLTPMAAAYGLKELRLPPSVRILTLESLSVIEATLSSLLQPLDISPRSTLVIGFDAEWNISRTTGVSIIQLSPQSQPDDIYIIPVHKMSSNRLPPSLLRILVSPRVYKVGSAIKADFTRLKKQFQQLADQKSFKLVDLKEFCIQQGVIERKRSGSLDALLEKTTHQYLPKDEHLRKSDDWERSPLRQDLAMYAALDAYASRIVFEEAQKQTPPSQVTRDTPPGTRITLYTEDGGLIAAHGTISCSQPASFMGVAVETSTRGRLLIDINEVVIPSAASTLHLLPPGKSSSNRAGTYSLSELQVIAGAQPPSRKFQMVAPTSHLRVHCPGPPEPEPIPIDPVLMQEPTLSAPNITMVASSEEPVPSQEDDSEHEFEELFEMLLEPDAAEEKELLKMLEAYLDVSQSELIDTTAQDHGAHKFIESFLPAILKNMLDQPDSLKRLDEIIASTPDACATFTRIKKDIFHGFHSLPLSRTHGATVPFLRTLRDHILRWDPESRERVDKVCRKEFGITFEQMLQRNSRFITQRTPRYIPSPSVLVAAIEHVFELFSNARDAKTGEVLFTPTVRVKANALLELARQGYFSDIDDVPMYERAGVDKYGLQKWRCLRGTNNVEGGPHGDIYRKFGALNAGPRFTLFSLDGTYQSLKAYASHLYNVDWEYHHNLSMINRTSFLLNYLSDVVGGAKSYQDWVNGDLYEPTDEQFGICAFPGE